MKVSELDKRYTYRVCIGGTMEFMSELKQHLIENNQVKVQCIQSKCYEILSNAIKNYDGKGNKVLREDKFAQCILTSEIKDKIVKSQGQKVIAGM